MIPMKSEKMGDNKYHPEPADRESAPAKRMPYILFFQV
jgi:hypothetical protein